MPLIYRKGWDVPKEMYDGIGENIVFGIDVEVTGNSIYPLHELRENECIIVVKKPYSMIIIKYTIYTSPRRKEEM